MHFVLLILKVCKKFTVLANQDFVFNETCFLMRYRFRKTRPVTLRSITLEILRTVLKFIHVFCCIRLYLLHHWKRRSFKGDFLKDVFPKTYLVYSWILWPIWKLYSYKNSELFVLSQSWFSLRFLRALTWLLTWKVFLSCLAYIWLAMPSSNSYSC